MRETEGFRTRDPRPRIHPMPWKTWIAIIGLGVSFYFELYWVMGLVYLGWAIDALRYRTAYLIEEIPRSQHPATYWVIVLMWLGLGIWTLLFAPESSASWQTSQGSDLARYGGMTSVNAAGNPTQPQNLSFEVPRDMKPG